MIDSIQIFCNDNVITDNPISTQKTRHVPMSPPQVQIQVPKILLILKLGEKYNNMRFHIFCTVEFRMLNP